MRKAKSRRGRAAFHGQNHHRGVAGVGAACQSGAGCGHWTAEPVRNAALALELLAVIARPVALPSSADRLYGCAAFLAPAQAMCARVGSHFLIRARSKIKVQTLRRLKDGSRLVRVPLQQKRQSTHHCPVAGSARNPRARPTPRLSPGPVAFVDQLARSRDRTRPRTGPIVAQRWEHELYYRELKRQLRKTDVLQSHTSGNRLAQEIAAIILASALLATQRADAAEGQTPVLRVSFIKTLELDATVVADSGTRAVILLTPRQKQQLTERFLQRHS